MDIWNCYAVAAKGDGIVILNPPRHGQVLSKDNALLLAAWLVAMADDGNRFNQILEEVQDS